ncbi:unnamed protein product [Pichia kudriavzevii]
MKKFTCVRPNFSSSLEFFSKKLEIQVEILSTVNSSAWYANLSRGKDLGIIRLKVDKETNEYLDGMLDSATTFGFFVKLNTNLLSYGFMYRITASKQWIIKPFKDKPLLVDRPPHKYLEDIDYLSVKVSNDVLRGKSTSLRINETFPDLVKHSRKYMQLQQKKAHESKDVLKSIDPIEFLLDQYFTILYDDSFVIERFVKFSVSKMHLLKHNNSQLGKECLTKLLVHSLHKFDKRYDIAVSEGTEVSELITKWLSPEILLDPLESKFRENIFNKLGIDKQAKVTFTDNGKIAECFNNLKIRDAKLQILIDMELLKVIKTEDPGTRLTPIHVPSTAKPARPKGKRTQLISKRYSNKPTDKKRRLIPTLLGSVIPEDFDVDVDLRGQSEPEVEITRETLEKLIEGLFEKLCVCDAIYGWDYKDDKSSWGFVLSCILPYYERIHRRIISNLAIKSRGPAYLLKLKTRKEKKEKEAKRQRKGVEKSHKSTERRSTNIDLSKIKLTRQNSSFSSSKIDLSRKIISMNESVSNSTGLVDDAPFSIERVDSSNGFMNNKKRKLQAPDAKSNQHPDDLLGTNVTKPKQVVQPSQEPIDLFYHNQIIEATPRKQELEKKQTIPELSYINGNTPHQDSGIIAGSSPFRMVSSPSKIITQITETPNLERIQVMPGVFEFGSSPAKTIIESPIIKSSKQTQDSEPNSSVKLNPIKSTKRKLSFK